MNNISAMAKYIDFCEREAGASLSESGGMCLMLDLPEGYFQKCLCGKDVYLLVQSELKKGPD